MAKDILKEAIADAKAVREVALANAKAALEEAFTPKLQSMLSAKLSEDLDEELSDDEELMHEDVDEMIDLEEEEEKDLDKTEPTDPSDKDKEKMDRPEESLSGEVDLEELLNELENMSEEEIDHRDISPGPTNPPPKDVDAMMARGSDSLEECPPGSGNYVPTGTCDEESKRPMARMAHPEIPLKGREVVDEEFDLDTLINEISSMDLHEPSLMEDDMADAHFDMDEDMMYDENVMYDEDMMYDEDIYEGHCAEGMYMTAEGHCMEMDMMYEKKAPCNKPGKGCERGKQWDPNTCKCVPSTSLKESKGCGCKKQNGLQNQLRETKIALNTVRTELNEVNLLNSKLLYVNRIFKSNNLSESNKIKVVETIDKATSTKEAKLIYETLKDTFKISKKKKTSSKRSIRENFGMASKSSGTTQSNARKNSIISESNDMVARFKKLANIKINE